MKRLIVFIVCIALILNMPVSFVYSREDMQNAEEISELRKKFEFLGINLDIDFSKQYVTRAEFVSSVLKMIRIDTDNISAEKVFEDVSEQNKYFKAVYSAYVLGLVSKSEKVFRPDEFITYNEMAKIFVTMLGYAPNAQVKGGYPSGYILVSQEIGIYVKNGKAYASVYDVISSMSLVLECKIPVAVSVSGGNVKYEIKKGSNILSEFYNIFIDEGILYSVGKCDLYGRGLADNRALIENKVYGFDYRNMSNLIGQTVKFYYKDDAFKTIVYAEPDGSDTVTVLNANDIISCDGKKYTYEGTSGKERYISLESSHFIMFNGRVASDITNDKYIPEFGCVKLIDNNGDGKYDVVIITSYENYVIKSVDADKKILYDRYDNKKSLCFDEEKNIDVNITTANGKEVFAATISEWSVVSATVSDDKAFVRAVVSSDYEEGIITSIVYNNDGSADFIINDKSLKMPSYAFKNYEAGEIKVNDYARFHLDFEGNIGAVEFLEKDGFEYAVALEAETVTDCAKPYNRLKILDFENEVKNFDVDLDAYIDGKKYTTYEAQKSALSQGLDIGKLVRIRKNDKEIADIDTLYVSEKESKDTTLYEYLPRTENLLYKNLGSLDGKLFINKTTKVVFYYPLEQNDEDKYFVTDMSKLANSTRYTACAYAVGETYSPQVVFIEQSYLGSSVTSNTLYVVEKMYKTFDEKDDEYTALKLNSGSENKVLYVENGIIDDTGIKPGDIIRADIVKEKYLLSSCIEKVYDFSENKLLTGYKKENGDVISVDAIFSTRLGYVYNKIGTYFSISVAEKIEDITDDYIVTNAPNDIIIVKKHRGNITVENAAASNLKGYKIFGDNASKTLALFKYTELKQLIIIENN